MLIGRRVHDAISTPPFIAELKDYGVGKNLEFWIHGSHYSIIDRLF